MEGQQGDNVHSLIMSIATSSNMVAVPGDRQEPVKAEADQGHGGQVEGEPSDEHLEAFQKVVHKPGAPLIRQTGKSS